MNPLSSFFEQNNPLEHDPSGVQPLTVGAEVAPLTFGASADVPVTAAEDEAMAVLTAAAPRFEEWHVTVKGDPIAWAEFCREHNLKPLFIELSNGNTQLMCASAFDPCALIHEQLDLVTKGPLFTILRVKHEVSHVREGEKPLYYEAHVKFNGPIRRDRKGTSRDLYRVHEQRWYMTYRSHAPFEASEFTRRAIDWSRPSRHIETEYEACLTDTNPQLDAGWL